jgi:predicted transcriptional regulator
VRLTESFLMLPTKTVSGIFFPTEATFESCQLCPREECPNRRAPYEQALYESHYAVKSAHG